MVMKIFVWRHSKLYSSWSMFDEPHICRHNYMQAEAVVVAGTQEEALALLERDDTWNIEELRRIEPLVYSVEKPSVVTKVVFSG